MSISQYITEVLYVIFDDSGCFLGSVQTNFIQILILG